MSISKGSPLALGASTGTVTQAAQRQRHSPLRRARPALSRHFLNVQPDVRDGTIGIDMVYEPRGPETDGLVNVYILDQGAPSLRLRRRFPFGRTGRRVAQAIQPQSNDLVAGYHLRQQ